VYATLSDLQALAPNLKLTMNSQVTREDAVSYLDQTGHELNGVLTARGYTVPIPPTHVVTSMATPPGGTVALPTWTASAVAPESFELLRRLEAQGGRAMLERAWPDSPTADAAEELWLKTRDMLAAGKIDLPDWRFRLSDWVASATAGASSL
jgi:hypothetical protein